MKSIFLFLCIMFTFIGTATAQPSNKTHRILIDVAHHQKFWNDPNDMVANTGADIDRVKYLTAEMKKSSTAVDASFGFIKSEIGKTTLNNCDILFIHVPTSQYNKQELKVIEDYIKNGGALFLVMEVDYWSTLDQTNVNDIVKPFKIKFEGQIPDSLSGGYTKAGPITQNQLKLIYHGGRIVKGGDPFCFNNQSKEYPFGIYKTVNNRGKLVVMGDGMVSLYMTNWNGVANYDSQAFMQKVLKWLLDK